MLSKFFRTISRARDSGRALLRNLRAERRERFLTYEKSRAMPYTENQKHTIRKAISLIRKNLKRLKDYEFEAKSGDIKIYNYVTGSYKGVNFGALTVEHGNERFFVKVQGGKKAGKIHEGLSVVRSHLKSVRNKIGDFNVEIIEPRELYETFEDKRPITYLVSDFVNRNEALQGIDIKDKNLHKRVQEAVWEIDSQIRKRMNEDDLNVSVHEITLQNVFYLPATKTILLFDIQAMPT